MRWVDPPSWLGVHLQDVLQLRLPVERRLGVDAREVSEAYEGEGLVEGHRDGDGGGKWQWHGTIHCHRHQW